MIHVIRMRYVFIEYNVNDIIPRFVDIQSYIYIDIINTGLNSLGSIYFMLLMVILFVDIT